VIDLSQGLEARTAARRMGLQRFVPVALVSLDAVLIYSGFAVAYYVRYILKIGPQIHDRVEFDRYQPVGILLVVIMVLVLAGRGAYRQRMSREVIDEVGDILGAATITTATIVVIDAMLHQFQYSRGVIVYLWFFVIVLVSAGRALFRMGQGYCHKRGWGVRRLLVVGASDIGKMVMQSEMSRPDLGYQLVGFVEHRATVDGGDFGRFRSLGTVADIPSLLESGDVDESIMAVPASAHEEAISVLALCEEHGVGLKLVPDLFEMSLSRVQVDDIAGIPLLDVREQPLRRASHVAKRALDIGGALIMLVGCAPVCALLALFIKLESDGPVLLRQRRIGVDGVPFTCLKFRTMRPDAELWQPALAAHNESDGPLFKMRDDPRCTRLGRHMRRWSLDEFPQFWNVLRGDMSLVGPRPGLPEEVARYESGQRRRLEVKPGMTGIWQVSGRSDLSFDEMVLMDIKYVDNWSLALDIKLLVRTVLAVLARHGAY